MSAIEKHNKYEQLRFLDNLLYELNRVPNDMRSQNWTALYNEYEVKIYDLRQELNL